MFYLLTKRQFKQSRVAKRFEATSSTHTEYGVSGPFTQRKTAERAAVLTLGTFTCLSSLVIEEEEARELMRSAATEYEIGLALKKALPVATS